MCEEGGKGGVRSVGEIESEVEEIVKKTEKGRRGTKRRREEDRKYSHSTLL